MKTKIITYSLKETNQTSDRFYADLQVFTTVALEKAQGRLGDMAKNFSHWIEANRSETQRTQAETLFELLVMGVLWHVYGMEAVGASRKMEKLLTGLADLRKRSPVLKPGADLLRGLLGGFSIHRNGKNSPAPPLTLERLDSLIQWLTASGEFKEEVSRLTLLKAFFATQAETKEKFRAIEEYAEWFSQASLDTLGNYTPKVEPFLEEAHAAYRWREDYIFTGRKRVEYHLNMVGTEIMNRAFRESFLKSGRKIIFVPPCMAAPADGNCQAKDTPYGARCEHCTPNCQVNQISRYGEKHGIQVFMIPDSFSPLSSGGGEGLTENSLGVVGVSCPLTIVSGGWEMRRLGIPAQGLLLDHCGCSWHWDLDQGVVTEINFRKLVEILED